MQDAVLTDLAGRPAPETSSGEDSDGRRFAVTRTALRVAARESPVLAPCTRLRIAGTSTQAVAASRAVFAGAAWSANASFDGNRLLVRPLTGDTASYEDDRIAAAVDRAFDEHDVQTLRRLISFVAGVDVQILCVERYDDAGVLVEVEHRRESPKVGGGTHSPFTGLDEAERERAVGALSEGFVSALRSGAPVDKLVDLITRSNNGTIHIGAQLHALCIEAAANWRAETRTDAAPRREQYARMLAEFRLDLDAPALERLMDLRHELLRRGYFHRDYPTSQKDIKFLRDIAHTIVLRLCSYTGPYYHSETQRVIPFI